MASDDEEYVDRSDVRLPEPRVHPIAAIGRRVLYALVALAIVWLIVLLDRDSYRDSADGEVSPLDALYYATVSLSTTGYGDITPVTNAARVANILLITPLRILFVGILVGTAFEVLTKRSRDELRRNRWRSRLSGHTVVIGYGTKGNTAIRTLMATGAKSEDFVVVDSRPDAVEEANRDGFAAIVGDATRASVLRRARVPDASRVLITTQRDDTAVLATLTARQLNPTCMVVAAVREAENEPLLLRSGANAVITSSAAAGRLLAVAARSPAVSEVFSDLLIHGTGLDLHERSVTPDEVGQAPRQFAEPVIAVIRDGQALRYDEVEALAPGDAVVVVRSQGQKV